MKNKFDGFTVHCFWPLSHFPECYPELLLLRITTLKKKYGKGGNWTHTTGLANQSPRPLGLFPEGDLSREGLFPKKLQIFMLYFENNCFLIGL